MTSNIKLLESFGMVRRGINIALTDLIKNMPIGHRQATIIRSLARYGELNQSTLALYTSTDPGTITRSVQQMIDQGLVEKIQSPEDGRHWLVRLTKKGHRHAPEVMAVYEQGADIFAEALSPTEKAQFETLLLKIGNHLEKRNKDIER